LMSVCVLVLYPARVFAQTSSSTNYSVTETEFGIGGELDTSSANYRAQGSAGALGVGDTSSTNYGASAGFINPNEPYLEMVVTSGTVSLGNLTDSTTGTGTGTFYIRTYLDSTYSVYTMSPTLTSEGGATINAMSSTAASSVGTEQFGINLVANTSPATFGADPVNIPDDTFADGDAATGYDTVNQFRYVQGEAIATSPKTATNEAVGRTNYTISYIANIAILTEAGTYTMNHDLVAVATY